MSSILKRLASLSLVAFLSLSACDSTSPIVDDGDPDPEPVNEDVILADRTRVFPEGNDSLIRSVSAEDSTIVFARASSWVDSLEVGQVMLFGITDQTPYGLMRWVDSMEKQGDETVVQTSQATLFDAFDRLKLKYSSQAGKTGSPIDFLFEREDFPLGGEEVRASVELRVAPQIEFDIDWDFPNLNHFRFGVGGSVDGELKVELGAEVALDPIRRPITAPITLQPLIIPVGGVPVILAFYYQLFGVLEPEFATQLVTGADFSASMDAGIDYSEGQWTAFGNPPDPTFGWIRPVLQGKAKLKGSIESQAGLLVYGLLGPTFSPEPLIELEATVDALDLDYIDWSLEAGFEVNVGVAAKFFGRNLLEYFHEADLGVRWPLANGRIGLGLGDDGGVIGRVIDEDGGAPVEGVLVQAVRGDDTKIAETGASGYFSLGLDPGNEYELRFSKHAFVPKAISTSIPAEGQSDLGDIEIRTGFGDLSGRVYDVETNAGIEGTTVTLRPGPNNQDGLLWASTKTGPEGTYRFVRLPVGIYTAEAEAESYLTSYPEFTAVDNTETQGQDIGLSKVAACPFSNAIPPQDITTTFDDFAASDYMSVELCNAYADAIEAYADKLDELVTCLNSDLPDFDSSGYQALIDTYRAFRGETCDDL